MTAARALTCQFSTQLTKAYKVDTSCNQVVIDSATCSRSVCLHQQRSNEPLWHYIKLATVYTILMSVLYKQLFPVLSARHLCIVITVSTYTVLLYSTRLQNRCSLLHKYTLYMHSCTHFNVCTCTQPYHTHTDDLLDKWNKLKQFLTDWMLLIWCMHCLWYDTFATGHAVELDLSWSTLEVGVEPGKGLTDWCY